MDSQYKYSAKDLKLFEFQLGHVFSDMDRAAIFRPLLLSKKSRFSHIPSTFMNTFRKLGSVRSDFRYAMAFRASPGVLDTTSTCEICLKN